MKKNWNYRRAGGIAFGAGWAFYLYEKITWRMSVYGSWVQHLAELRPWQRFTAEARMDFVVLTLSTTVKKMKLARIAFMVLFIGLLSSTLRAQTTDSLIVQLSRKWVHARAYALKMAELMPEKDYDFRPVPGEMSFKQQLMHLADNIVWLSTSYLSPDLPKRKIDTANLGKQEVMKIVSDAYDLGLKAQTSLPVNQLDKKVKFFAGPMTIRQILLLLHDHQSHHLGQVIVYLRLKGIRPPDYVGW